MSKSRETSPLTWFLQDIYLKGSHKCAIKQFWWYPLHLCSAQFVVTPKFVVYTKLFKFVLCHWKKQCRNRGRAVPVKYPEIASMLSRKWSYSKVFVDYFWEIEPIFQPMNRDTSEFIFENDSKYQSNFFKY
jgi:hypothetical protein